MKKPITGPFRIVSCSPSLGENNETDGNTATQPACPSAMLQWQHGTYTLEANGSLILKPFEVDGRQVMSSPCSYDESIYTRYKNPEMIKVWDTNHLYQTVMLSPSVRGTKSVPIHSTMSNGSICFDLTALLCIQCS